MDDALARITARVWRDGDPNDTSNPRQLLTIEAFFEGNDVVGSIGCNLEGAPAPEEIAAVLRSIAERVDVADVRVAVTMFDDPAWPFSDTVVIVTSASPDEVQSWWPESLAPDESSALGEGLGDFEPLAVPADCQAIYCWWD